VNKKMATVDEVKASYKPKYLLSDVIVQLIDRSDFNEDLRHDLRNSVLVHSLHTDAEANLSEAELESRLAPIDRLAAYLPGEGAYMTQVDVDKAVAAKMAEFKSSFLAEQASVIASAVAEALRKSKESIPNEPPKESESELLPPNEPPKES
jgi:hypothetical protein